MIFEDEYGSALEIKNQAKTNCRTCFRDMIILSRLMFQEEEQEDVIRTEIRRRICLAYSEEYEGMINILLNRIIRNAKKLGPLDRREISFSKEEFDFVHSLNDLTLEKLMFCIMCLYKVSKYNNFSIPFDELRRQTGVRCRNDLLQKFRIFIENGYIELKPYKSKLEMSVTDLVTTLYNPDNIIVNIENKKNIVYYYLDYIGEDKYFYCSECGCIEKQNKNVQKYCKDCSKIIKNEQNKMYYKNKLGK